MTGTAAIIILNMIFKQLPMVMKLTSASLAQLNSRVEDAARDLGAGRFFCDERYCDAEFKAHLCDRIYLQLLQRHDHGGSRDVLNQRQTQAGSVHAV